jgi:hypothetical protein
MFALLGLLFLAGGIIVALKYTWPVLVAIWLVRAVRRRIERTASEHRRQRLELEALLARADQQQAWCLAGDERGIYGDYPPARGC